SAWFPFLTVLTIGGKRFLTPFGRLAYEIRKGLEYIVADEEAVMSKRSKRLEYMPVLYPNAAGLDIGSREIYAWVPPERADEPVKAFGTFTPNLNSLADWLVEHGVDTVAMESTGVYWIPTFELLEARGFKVFLVNARNIKGVPGRKSDVA